MTTLTHLWADPASPAPPILVRRQVTGQSTGQADEVWGWFTVTADAARPADIELLNRAAAGDAESFAVLFDRYDKRVLNVCWRVVQHREDAEDAAALAFLELWNHRDRVRHVDGSVWPWLLTTTINVCQTYRRGRGPYRSFLAQLRPETPSSAAATEEVDSRVEREALLGPTWTAFAKLTANEQTILMLCVLEELPQEEVARTLGLTLGTVKSRLSRAKERLRRQMETDSSLLRRRAQAEGEG
jgi:RNA polymerase sigma-70 factor (ECF subfamily)